MPARSPQELPILLAEAITSGDVEAFIALYEPGAASRSAQGEVHGGVDAIRRYVTPVVSARPDFKLEIKQVVEAGDIAVIHTESSRPERSPSRAVDVARRQPDGTWRMVIYFDLGAA